MTASRSRRKECAPGRPDGRAGSTAPHFAGLPLAGWAFALRTWAAMMLALYVAFWLQLEGASSAATCVGILSLQTRGQVFSKAVYRTAGTAIGLAASLAIAGVFSQTRDLFFLAACAWLGGCTVVASLLDGTQTYCAILSGYTVAIVALPNVDTPLQTFSSAVNRGAAITIGIAAVALVNDLFQAPDLFPTVLGKLEAARDKARALAAASLRGGQTAQADAAALLKQITALHPDIIALSAESVAGRARRDAADLASVSLVRVVSATRIAATALASLNASERDAWRERVGRTLDGSAGSVEIGALDGTALADASSDRLIAAAASLALAEYYQEASAALDALADGRPPRQTARLSLYKSRSGALRSGLRAGLAWAISSALFSVLSWPGTIATLSQLGVMVGLSSVSPNPRGVATAAVIAIPLVAAAAGITEFLVLDGVDEFPLLALGMGPTIIFFCLLLTTGKPALGGIGFLALVYFPFILSPANPQSYNPQSYVLISFLTILSTVALFLLLATLLPTDDAMRRGWMLTSAHADLRAALFDTTQRLDPTASAYRDADRIGQFSALTYDGDRAADLGKLIRMSDLAACARRIRAALAGNAVARETADRARTALAGLEPLRLRDVARHLLRTAPESATGPVSTNRVAVDLLLAATLIERNPQLVAALDRGRAR